MSETDVVQVAIAGAGTSDVLDRLRPVGADSPWIILCDFDGTISQCDVSDALIERFGGDGCEALEAAWVRGDIGSRACMSGQIARLTATKAEIDQLLDTIDIDPHFAGFVRLAEAQGIEVQVVSDGLDYAIHRILARFDLDHLPVRANRLLQRGEQAWYLEFPYANDDCRQASGNCKCRRAAALQANRQRILFVGDGTSDFCVSSRVDVVLAKDRLIDHCREHNLAFHPIKGFQDALDLLPHVMQEVAVEAWGVA
ncbi:MtnX-like HAD-IB family phosphatase [Mangrovitalea sediminis]|uniref:MtnX-like HAD-IB family phosphatase n=1 Tax=Mangrovitalea sediminis TaxID=1982043 RepID=UPI000BE60E32|nr:MtnX-like HAD-IB family phosphatase [Mangrovitalea sediminis]